MANTIGIDFGTTKTMVSYLNPATGRVELVRLGRDRDSIPTTVHIDESGAFLFGEDADDQIETDPEGYCRAFKLHLGEKDPALSRSDETAESLAARFLRHVKEECEQSVFHGEAVSKATITVPVSFAPARKASLKRASEAAGFSSVSFLPEPEAAGTAFLRDNPADKFSRALVLDWGGGTLDIAIISRDEDGTIHADRHCAEGRDDVGGEEMDRGLLEDLNESWSRTFGFELISAEENEPRLLRETEKVKIGLSRKDAVSFRRGPKKIDITRKHFNVLVMPLLDAAVELVRSALSKNKANGHPEPDAILLIGGTSQSPIVRETMEKRFPKLRVLSWHHSHEAVALGATQDKEETGAPGKERRPGLPGKRSAKSAAESTSRVEHDDLEKALALAVKLSNEKGDLSSLDKKAANLIAQAAQDGNSRAAGFLAAIYHDGCNGFLKNVSTSFQWAKTAAEAGDAHGQAWLSLYYLGMEENNPVRKNRNKALEWAEKAHSGDKRLSNKGLLMLVLSSFDNPDTGRIKRLGREILRQAGEGSPERFVFDDRAAIGTACLLLSNMALEDNDSEKALSLLQKGVAFGSDACEEALSGLDRAQNEPGNKSVAVTDEAIRLFAKFATIDGRRNQPEQNFMEEWLPGVCSSEPWTRPLRVSETIETLAAAAAESYGNDQEQLGHLLSILRAFAVCDGPADDEETAALQWVSYIFRQRSTAPKNTDAAPSLRIRPTAGSSSRVAARNEFVALRETASRAGISADEVPPVSLSVRPGMFSSCVLKVRNISDCALQAHLRCVNEQENPNRIEHDFMIAAWSEAELGWLELPRRLLPGETGTIICQGYSSAIQFFLTSSSEVSTGIVTSPP